MINFAVVLLDFLFFGKINKAFLFHKPCTNMLAL